MNNFKRYNDLSTYLTARFGCKVQKVSIDAGLSCPNRDGTISSGGCTYCNAKGSGTGAHRPGASLTEQILDKKRHMAWRFKAKKFIAYFQSFTNTYAPIEQLKSLYDEALAVEDMVGLFVGTRPDCVDEPVLELLQHYNKTHMVWIDYGLQSVHDATLARINRGHDFRCFEKAVDSAKRKGIKVCAHVILGLPGENREQMMETAKVIAGMGIDGIKIHMLYVTHGTELERQYRRGDFYCLEQKEYINLVCDFLELLPKEMVMHRLVGDAHNEELVAPMWALEKSDTMNKIHKTMAERDTWQGERFTP